MAPEGRLTYEGYVDHGLGDLIGRFVANAEGVWLLVSYAFPGGQADVDALQAAVEGGGATLSGLPLVNRELAERFTPQFLKGLAIGTIVVVALIAGALRDWRLSVLSLTPAIMGLVWAAGILALARVELDLFAVFAVVTFVGIGVDYGVHMVHRYQEHNDAARAIEELAPVILIAGAITLLGYGTLVTSSYPPLQSIGVVSVVTVLTLVTASIVVLPALLTMRPSAPAGSPARRA
jgi:predicted RND superfamily exporter protein